MKPLHIAELRDYALDHYAHFDAWPVEFEASDGTVYGYSQLWEYLPFNEVTL